MTKIDSIVLHVAASITAAVPVLAASRAPSDLLERPNVVLIMTDDQGYGDFSCMGHPYVKTPQMDNLKSESVSFDNFVVAPVCAPTRAALMTGRSHYRTGVHDTYQSRVNMWTDEKTIAEYMKDAGYVTGMFGKWHLGYNYPLRPGDQGFDIYATWEEMHHSRIRPLVEENGRQIYYDKFVEDVFADKVVDFIRENQDRPFFCYFPTYLPHRQSDNIQVEEKYYRHFLEGNKELSRMAAEEYGMIEYADKLVGRVLQAIDDYGLRENTIVIFMSDNGPTMRRTIHGKPSDENYGLRGRKGGVYEGGIRVPFMVRWPGHLQPGARVDRMGTALDVLPTVLALCDVTPAQWQKPLDGVSLAPLLKNPGAAWNDRFYCMHFQRGGPQQIRSKEWENSCVRGERYKLVNGTELYDLQDDPAESNNLAAEMPKKVQQMRKIYEDWFTSVTEERNLTAAPNAIGAPEQKSVNLYFFEKDQEADPSGWPVEVLSEGPYTIGIENIRHDMFGTNAQCVIRCGDMEISKPVLSNQAFPNLQNVDLIFEGVTLPLGRHTLQIDIEGEVQQKTWRFGLDDLGHRLVWIRKENQ